MVRILAFGEERMAGIPCDVRSDDIGSSDVKCLCADLKISGIYFPDPGDTALSSRTWHVSNRISYHERRACTGRTAVPKHDPDRRNDCLSDLLRGYVF